MRQLILKTDKKTDGSIIYTLIEVEQTEVNYIRFPWNAQSINQAVLDLLVQAIAEQWGVEPTPIDLIEIGEKIAIEQGIEFRRMTR